MKKALKIGVIVYIILFVIDVVLLTVVSIMLGGDGKPPESIGLWLGCTMLLPLPILGMWGILSYWSSIIAGTKEFINN